MKQHRKQPQSWPKPADFELDDDTGVLIGNRIHRLVAGQVIGQQVIHGNSHTTFASPGVGQAEPAARQRPRPAARTKASQSKQKPRARRRQG